MLIEETKFKIVGEEYIEIRVAIEQDGEGIAEVYANDFFKDWKQLFIKPIETIGI